MELLRIPRVPEKGSRLRGRRARRKRLRNWGPNVTTGHVMKTLRHTGQFFRATGNSVISVIRSRANSRSGWQSTELGVEAYAFMRSSKLTHLSVLAPKYTLAYRNQVAVRYFEIVLYGIQEQQTGLRDEFTSRSRNVYNFPDTVPRRFSVSRIFSIFLHWFYPFAETRGASA